MPGAIEPAAFCASTNCRLGTEIAGWSDCRPTLLLSPTCRRRRSTMDTQDIAVIGTIELPARLALARSLTTAYVANHPAPLIARRTWKVSSGGRAERW